MLLHAAAPCAALPAPEHYLRRSALTPPRSLTPPFSSDALLPFLLGLEVVVARLSARSAVLGDMAQEEVRRCLAAICRGLPGGGLLHRGIELGRPRTLRRLVAELPSAAATAAAPSQGGSGSLSGSGGAADGAAAPQPTSAQPRACGSCGAATARGGGRLKICTGCDEARYCSRDCATRAWPAHKAACRAAQAARRRE